MNKMIVILHKKKRFCFKSAKKKMLKQNEEEEEKCSIERVLSWTDALNYLEDGRTNNNENEQSQKPRTNGCFCFRCFQWFRDISTLRYTATVNFIGTFAFRMICRHNDVNVDKNPIWLNSSRTVRSIETLERTRHTIKHMRKSATSRPFLSHRRLYSFTNSNFQATSFSRFSTFFRGRKTTSMDKRSFDRVSTSIKNLKMPGKAVPSEWDLTPDEMKIVEKRAQLRQATKAEFLKQYRNPFNSGFPGHFVSFFFLNEFERSPRS